MMLLYLRMDFLIVGKSMLALQAGGGVKAERVWNRTIATIINTTKKLGAKDGTCAETVEREVICLLFWVYCYAYLWKKNSYTEC